MKIGYVRVSTAEQNTARQEVIMEALEADSVYIDRVSGKDTRRPELQKMLSYLRPGDTVVVESISRFARNTKDLLELMETLEAKGAAFISQKEAIDTTTPSGKFMLTVFGAMDERNENKTHRLGGVSGCSHVLHHGPHDRPAGTHVVSPQPPDGGAAAVSGQCKNHPERNGQMSKKLKRITFPPLLLP